MKIIKFYYCQMIFLILISNLNNENLGFIYVSQFVYIYHVQNVECLVKKFKTTLNGG